MRPTCCGAAASFAFLALCATAAVADPPLPPAPATSPAEPGHFYLSLGANAQVYELPRFNHFAIAAGGSGDLFSAHPQPGGGGLDAGLGYVLPAGMLGWAGDHARIELAGASFYGSDSNTTIVGGPFSVRVTSIDGTTSFVGGFPRLAYTGTLETAYQAFALGPRLKADRAVTPDLTLSPSIAALAGADKTSDRLNFLQSVAGGLFLPGSVNEKITSWHAGPELGLDATWRANEVVSFNAGAAAGVYFQRVRLSGTDCEGNFAVASPICDGTAFRTSIAARNDAVGARLGQSLGVAFSWPAVSVSILGLSAWTYHVPGVQNPNALGQTARLRYDDLWDYGAAVMVTVPFR